MIKKDIIILYGVEKSKIQRVIDENKARVAVTTDMWTATYKRGYMAMIAHYIDNNWKLRSHLIWFLYVPVP